MAIMCRSFYTVAKRYLPENYLTRKLCVVFDYGQKVNPGSQFASLNFYDRLIISEGVAEYFFT